MTACSLVMQQVCCCSCGMSGRKIFPSSSTIPLVKHTRLIKQIETPDRQRGPTFDLSLHTSRTHAVQRTHISFSQILACGAPSYPGVLKSAKKTASASATAFVSYPCKTLHNPASGNLTQYLRVPAFLPSRPEKHEMSLRQSPRRCR